MRTSPDGLRSRRAVVAVASAGSTARRKTLLWALRAVVVRLTAGMRVEVVNGTAKANSSYTWA